MPKPWHLLLILLCLVSCAGKHTDGDSGMEYARWFSLKGDTLAVISPYDGSVDTTVLHKCSSLVCMSSSHVGYLEVIGAGNLAAAVSGVSFLADSTVRSRAAEAGYDSAPDYETILSLRPDYVIMYAISSAPTQAMLKLRDLGIPILMLHEHLEPHPLGRAEYVKLFGVLAGCPEKADSIFNRVRDNYLALAHGNDTADDSRVKVLLNIPYGDQWYIPGIDNYLYRLISDAGGTVLGAAAGTRSSVISIEQAYSLSREADVWLNPGWCSTKAELASVHPLFSSFPVLSKSVWNNTAKATPGGGNDFWESGPARPDIILRDLCTIFDKDSSAVSSGTTYFRQVK